jgi:hypothetical protein
MIINIGCNNMDMVAMHYVWYEHLKYRSQCDFLSSVIEKKWRILHFYGTNLFLKHLNKNQRKVKNVLFCSCNSCYCRSQWPRRLRRRSAAARRLRLWVRISPGHGHLSGVSVVCCQRSLRWVLLTVVRRCVWSRNLVNEEALVHYGL